MSKNSEHVKKWRERTKARITEAMGGKCVCCGYDRCMWAFDLHHIDPTKKEFPLGKIRANVISWSRIIQELNKCVLLCSNCHREVHQGLIQIPVNAQSFNPDYSDYKALEKSSENAMDACPICNTMKPKLLQTCSLSCAGKKSGLIDWNFIDLALLLKTKSIIEIAEDLGISSCAVRKRLAKIDKLNADKNITCQGCGNLYDRKHGNQKHCSKKCANRASRRKALINN